MLWGKMTQQYTESAMGYDGDINNGSWQNRGWNWPNLVTYAESHDEERAAFRLTSYGNASGDYDTKQEATAMDRLEMMHAFLLAIPGPKMMWSWGELGYQISIFDCLNGTFEEGCKLNEKPAPWEDLENEHRVGLAKTIAALNHLKKTQPVFGTYDFNVDGSGKGKRIHLYSPDQNAVLVGNFDVIPMDIVPGFPYTGAWHDYFSGEEIAVNDLGNAWSLQPGEWRLLMDTPLPTPDTDGSAPIVTNVGCMDAAAQNYDPAAEADNGACMYVTTLELDLSDVEASPLGVHVAGSFQGWNPGGTAMELGEDGVYRASFVAVQGDVVQYKFVNGNDWGQDEGVPAECGAPNGLGGFNRELIVGGADGVISAVCFGTCESCGGIVAPAGCEDGDCCGAGTLWDATSGTCVGDGSAVSNCPEDLDGDGAVSVSDVLQMLGAFGDICE
jgi:hypothetical protein